MKPKAIVAISVVSLCLAFALGRYSVDPPAITKVEDTKKDLVKDIDRDTHKEITTVTEKDPDGKTKTTTTVTEDTSTKKHEDLTIDKHEDLTITPTKRSTLNISALAGIDVRQKTAIYGAAVNKEILGPVTLGVFGLTNGTVGVSVGINF